MIEWRGPGLYEIKNTVNGKRYVGSSVNVRSRAMGHRRLLDLGKHHNPHLQFSWTKHGATVFVFRLVAKLEQEDLRPTETRWLDRIVGGDLCYNIARDASAPTRGRTMKAGIHAERVARRRASGWTLSPEARARISASLMGHSHSPETRRKISLSLTGRKVPPEVARLHSGWRHSQSAKDRISAGLRGRPVSEDTRRKIGDSKRNMPRRAD